MVMRVHFNDLKHVWFALNSSFCLFEKKKVITHLNVKKIASDIKRAITEMEYPLM